MHPLLFLLVLLNLTLSASLSDPGQDEKTALLRFKNSTRSDPLGLLTSWTPLSDHCSWLGVTCDSSARVTALNISAKFQSGLSTCMNSRSGPFRPSCSDPARRLSGQLSSALGQLTELQIISLPFQDLNGEIPAEIWRLEKLQVVDFEGNSFSGTLDSALRFPLGLRVLNLAGNLITGEIPESLSNCVGLETLDLSGNYINGSIPKFVGNFSKLRVLYLSYNLLASSVPVEIGKCRNLVTLDLSGNGLKGEIPSSLGNCSDLKYLLLSSNLLEGSVPFSIGKLRKLQVLDVSRNCLSGAVPAELGDCVDLSVLVLSNQYSVLPNEGLFSRSATDEFNSFQGRLSEKITSLSNLRVVWAPQTALEGEFPKNWGACKSMEMVNLGGNFLEGEIPTSFALCQNLKVFNVSLNNMTGSLREELPVTCMSVFDVSGNNLSGVIPKFNYRKCPPSPFLNNDVPAMYLSFLMDRTRRGISLPTFESDGVSLVYHNFRRNGFTGSLPALSTVNFGNSSVYAFLADENYLVGSLNYTLFGKCGYFAGLILSLRNNLISGGVPADIAAMCECLVVFDVAGNRITGMIPKDIGKLAGLKYLSVARNNLSGPVPVELSQLQSIELLDLSSNSLTGEIPSNLASLRNLSILLLNNNTLYGSIPSAFANATSLSIFNASFNNLSGIYPNASILRCDCVIGNPLLQSCTALSLSSPPSQKTTESIEEGSPPKSGNSGFGSIEIASVASASSITTVLFVFIVFYIYLRKWGSGSSVHAPTRREVIIFVDIGVPLTYEAVVGATGSFNASNCIGSGGFGATYRAEVSPGVLVAIKRLAIGRIQGVQQFHAEVRTLGRGRHPNLVTLIGYHIGDAEMFLVYNYLPGGNLERFIQERSKRAIDWRMLHKIALDVAKALAYLHHQCVPRILHRDVKPSNILLDNQFNAYLSDFGLARLIGNSETHATTGVAGTFGYVAPEYAMTCRVSDKADVYSYGVVLLELLSDKKALDPSFSPYGNGFNIVAWACMLIEQGREHEFFVEGLWEAAPHDDLVDTLRLGVKCTDSLIVRPAMNHVVRRLKELQPPS